MDTAQIESALTKLFHEQGQRLVFWNDPELEFSLLLSAIKLEGVKVLRLDQCGAFEAKLRMERDDATAKYLIYSPSEEPDYENDWLLDVRLYSKSFRADRASIILSDLGLAHQHLRQHIHDRRKFFDSKDRLRKLQTLVVASDIEADLDLKMIAVLTKAEQPDPFIIVRTLFHAFTEATDNGGDLDAPPVIWEQVQKYDLEEPFWEMMKNNFGYREDSPTLKNLLIRLLVTDFAHHLKGTVSSMEHLLLPKAGRPNTIVCLAQWRDSASKGNSYDRLSAVVASIVSIAEELGGREIETLLEVMTFLDVEKAIITGLRDRVISTAETINADEVRQIAGKRLSGHWANANVMSGSIVPREALTAVYDALVAAADLFDLRHRYKGGFAFETAKAMYAAYETEIYRFDQLYRHFCENADLAEAKSWDVLKKLRAQIEGCYANWYLPTLAMGWGKFMPGDTGLLKKWQIEGVRNQHQFFNLFVLPPLNEAENRKVFVIISDAFRYEAAQELTTELNGKYRFQADLSSQLSVLPSYTALGMASLLPHKTLAYKANGDVIVDGKPTSGVTNRDEILSSAGGMAVKAEELLAKKKDEGREFVRGKQIVYIYHNTVDVIGDDAKSEQDTFLAVRKAINELAALVGYVVNNLNGHTVFVTADHGFLFTESAPTEVAKSDLPFKPEDTVISKKRFLLGMNLQESDQTWHGKTSVTAASDPASSRPSSASSPKTVATLLSPPPRRISSARSKAVSSAVATHTCPVGTTCC